VQEDPSVTPEQRKVVQQILAAKSYYEIMGLKRDASEADIKSAYKKVRQKQQQQALVTLPLLVTLLSLDCWLVSSRRQNQTAPKDAPHHSCCL
jgi:hypothetical protein